ncbi:hypothetical protein HZB60_02490 [candidate division KSB1 bacterium]|nr:hypothetical protein [candidate division KSB1 bacterium]
MRTILIFTLLIALGGCVGDESFREVESLRKSGDIENARALAIQLVNEKPDRMKVWLEFCRLTTELVRPLEVQDKDPLPYLLQASLVCAAISLRHKQEPPDAWREIGRFLAVALSRQGNILLSEMNEDIKSVDYRTTLSELPGGTTGAGGSAYFNAISAVEDARRNARSKVERMTVITDVLAALPTNSPGAQAVVQQLDVTRPAWAGSLELKPDYLLPLTENMHNRWQGALEKAVGDLKELGYFLPGTILENGVY